MKHTPEFIAYKATLPKAGNGIAWTIESFSKAVTLLSPGFKVEANQKWGGVEKSLWLVCPEHSRYQVQPSNFLTQSRGSGCNECSTKKCTDSAGITRNRKASESEKNEAQKLYAELGNYEEVARILGRRSATIKNWCDPDIYEKQKLRSARWKQANRGRHNANSRRYRKEFPHGRASQRTGQARYRKLKLGEFEWLDEISGLVNILSPPTTGEDLTKEQAYYLECERLTKETGITHHVDHIWPLSQGGPHVFYNLQVITADENLSKGNKYRPEDKALYAMRVAMLFAGTI